MRIAIVAEPYVPIPPSQYGGIEQVIYYLVKDLKEAGHEPILLAAGDSTVDCELIPIIPKALYFPRHKKDLPAHQRLVRKAERNTTKALRELLPRIDIIHSHGYDLSKFKNFPNLTTLHNKVEFKDLDYLMKRRNLFYTSISKNQQAVCPSLHYMGAVYNGEDPDQFPLVTKPENYLTFLGRLDRDKNPHLAIELAIHLGMKIKLAGKIDHDGEEYFENEVKPYLKHPLVEYLGELGFDDKVELLSKAKCNLHPTNFREPFGLTVIEAAYCGTPTLAISRGSMPELIEAGRTGMLVEDFIEGRYAIENCFAMDREYIASRARRLFNYHNMAREYLQIYRSVVAAVPQPETSSAGRLVNILRQTINYLPGMKAPASHAHHSR